jgi:hypothetical protein
MNLQPSLDFADLDQSLHGILQELYQKLGDRFDLTPEPSNQPLQAFSSPDNSVSGSLQTFVAPDIDWLVLSWLKAPQRRFSTMRLTTWLAPTIRVPHLVFELGVIPQPFFYMDYIPRVDLWSHPNYIEQFYEPVNPMYLKLRDHRDLSVFVSKGLYVRLFQSPVHVCFTSAATPDCLELIQTTAHEMCDRWLTWIDQATPVAADEQATLANRDACMRRISAERDPGNAMAIQIFGEEMADQLVRSLSKLDQF